MPIKEQLWIKKVEDEKVMNVISKQHPPPQQKKKGHKKEKFGILNLDLLWQENGNMFFNTLDTN